MSVSGGAIAASSPASDIQAAAFAAHEFPSAIAIAGHGLAVHIPQRANNAATCQVSFGS